MIETKPSDFEAALRSLKVRGERAVELGQEILFEMPRWSAESALPKSFAVAKGISATIERLVTKGLPSLQKEVGEALVAGAALEEALEGSSVALEGVLDLVRYRYGSDAPIVLEFFTPPNRLAFGQTPEKRLHAHARVEEAFARHADDFPKDDEKARFAAAASAGEAIRAAFDVLGGERSEGKTAVAEMVGLLAEFRSQVTTLRRRLLGELDDPEALYRIIPKVTRKK